MRILHTSDWHLGRSFHGMSLHDLSAQLLDELVETVQTEKIDAVLVSGDVYDQAQPRTETVGLLSRTLERLNQLGTAIVLTSGNHDSAIRLGFAAELLEQTGVYLGTDPHTAAKPVLLEKDGQSVAVYALPYLEPRALAGIWGTATSHQAVLGHLVKEARADLAGRKVTASILMAHCFASGASQSDSERNIRVGGIETVSADLFEGFSYTALGHLHGRQQIGENIRYSGSLLAYSFSEEKHRKGAWILDIDDRGKITVSEHLWSTRLQLLTLRGTLAELIANAPDPRPDNAIYRVYLTDQRRPAGALEALRKHFGTIAELYFDPPTQQEGKESRYRQEEMQTKSLTEICHDFYGKVRAYPLNQAETDYLKDIYEQAETAEVQA